MTPLDLAYRATTSPHWRWVPGMRPLQWVPAFRDHGSAEGRFLGSAEDVRRVIGCVPDLADPATLGCLIALVQETRDAPRAFIRLSADSVRWHVFDPDQVSVATGSWRGWLSGDCDTWGEALVMALVDAP